MTDALNPSPVLARADALMQRRRQNAAGDFEDVPLLTDVVTPDDDIPVVSELAAPAEAADDIGPAVLKILADELAEQVRAKLAAEIPSLVEATLHTLVANLTNDLQQGIGETTEHALRDFIAQREKLAKQQQR